MASYKTDTIRPLLIASLLLGISMLWLCFNFYHIIVLSQQKDQIDTQRYLLVTFRSAVVDAETGQRGYLITNNVSFFDAYTEGKTKALETYQAIADNYQLFPAIKPLMLQVKALSDEKFNIIESSIQVQLDAGAYASHLTLSKDKGRTVMNEIKLKLENADLLLLAQRQTYEKQIKKALEFTILCGLLLVIIIVGILIFSYKRTIKLFETVLETKEASESFAHQAEHDMLTGLPNRRGFEHFIELTHSNAHQRKLQYAILYMDLDGFKAVNDDHGHNIGDNVLVEVAKIITGLLREHDFLARLGGDEFAIVINHFHHQKSLIDIASRIIASLNRPLNIAEQTIQIGVSIGIARFPHDAIHKETLISMADAAMYFSKKKGKNQFSFISDTLAA
ncbi:diguanylate cyclase domain-containing protein [Methylotenera sp. 1P/1]|uniref:diguanylate cyclase domain-containing protein n=1 Tax=Methylotenera sp. 1P/1 TaxID=1131551 RepID=UPI00037FC00E|nr:diguanylate cyclase [Methylotenera sp. 1P/1]